MVRLLVFFTTMPTFTHHVFIIKQIKTSSLLFLVNIIFLFVIYNYNISIIKYLINISVFVIVIKVSCYQTHVTIIIAVGPLLAHFRGRDD